MPASMLQASRFGTQLSTMKSALLVIDVQQGLCEGEHSAFESSKVIDRMNIGAAKARAAGVPVVFIQHEAAGGYLEYGTPAWQLAKRLQIEPSDLRVRKSTPNSFLHTNLEEILREHSVTDLIICGSDRVRCPLREV